MAAFTIVSITSKSGTTINLPPSGVLCVVGGNNVGKSQFLGDIMMRISGRRDDLPSVLVEEVDYRFLLNASNAVEWLHTNVGGHREPGGTTIFQAPGSENGVTEHNFLQWISNQPRPYIDHRNGAPPHDW